MCACMWRSGVRTVSTAANATAWRLQIIYSSTLFVLVHWHQHQRRPHLLITSQRCSSSLTSHSPHCGIHPLSSGCPAHLHLFSFGFCVRRKIGIWTLNCERVGRVVLRWTPEYVTNICKISVNCVCKLKAIAAQHHFEQICRCTVIVLCLLMATILGRNCKWEDKSSVMQKREGRLFFSTAFEHKRAVMTYIEFIKPIMQHFSSFPLALFYPVLWLLRETHFSRLPSSSFNGAFKTKKKKKRDIKKTTTPHSGYFPTSLLHLWINTSSDLCDLHQPTCKTNTIKSSWLLCSKVKAFLKLLLSRHLSFFKRT